MRHTKNNTDELLKNYQNLTQKNCKTSLVHFRGHFEKKKVIFKTFKMLQLFGTVVFKCRLTKLTLDLKLTS